MGLRNRIRNATFGFSKTPLNFNKKTTTISKKEIQSLLIDFAKLGGYNLTDTTAMDNLEIIYRCITIITESIRSTPFAVYKMVGVKEKPVPYKELNDFLKKPNPVMSGKQLMEQTEGWLLIKGKAYWWIPQEDGKQKTIWILSSNHIRPEDESVYPPRAYLYSAGGGQIRIPKEELIIFSTWSPLSPFRSSSPMQSTLHTANLEQKAAILSEKIFDNSGMMSGLLSQSTDKDISEEESNKLMAIWQEKYSGVKSAGKVALLTGGWQYQRFGITPQEMENLASRKFNRENIITAFGCQPGLVGVMEYANYANLEAQERIFYERGILPKLDFIKDVIDTFYLPRFRTDLYFDFETENLPIVKAIERANYQAYDTQIKSGVLTINEYRNKFTNNPAVPWGDEYRVAGFTEVVGTLAGTPLALYEGNNKSKQSELNTEGAKISDMFPSLKDKPAIENKTETIPVEVVIQLTKRQAYSSTNILTAEARKKIWLKFDRILITQEDKFQKTVKRLLKDQHKKLTGQLKPHLDNLKGLSKTDFDKLYDLDGWVDYYYRALRSLYYTFIKQAGEDVLIDIGLSPTVMNMANPAILDFLGQRGQRALVPGEWWTGMANYVNGTLRLINLTTSDDVWNAIQQGIANQLSIVEIEQLIVGAFNIDFRSERIARTETMTANNFGHIAAYEQSGVVDGKEWLATQDDRTRDEHLQADGQVVGLHETFIVGGEQLQFPGDPNASGGNRINCRCRSLPVLRE